MKAMYLSGIRDLSKYKAPLDYGNIDIGKPNTGEVLIKVHTCGVCHTELDEIEGRTPPPFFPVIPGHQVVGHVEETGPGVTKLAKGTRVGVAWIYSSCGKCEFCQCDLENLCPEFKATGRDAHGGYAEYMLVPEDFAFPLPDVFDSA